MSNYVTKKELDNVTRVSICDLATKKAKVDNLDVGKSKNVPVDFKILSDVADNEVLKNTKFNILQTKANNSKKKISDATNLIHINQYNSDKQNLEEKNWICL